MPARLRTITPEISEQVSAHIRAERIRRGWEVPDLSFHLAQAGYKISDAVINSIENGVIEYREGSAFTRTRFLSVDECVAFAKVLGISLMQLIEGRK